MGWRGLPLCWFASLCLLLPASAQAPQSPADTPYTLRVPVDEIALTFHAADADGKPLTHLTRNDLKLKDNGKRQDRIVMLQSYEDLPIRVGFLFDISASMYWSLPYNRSVIRTYASRLLRPETDRAFVMQFDTETLITQPWTNDPTRIAAGAAAIPGKIRTRPTTSLSLQFSTRCTRPVATSGHRIPVNPRAISF